MNNSHKNKKKLFKILGLILLVIGLLLSIGGFVSFAFSFINQTFNPLFFLTFIGFPMIAISLFLLMLGFKKEMNTYIKNEDIPVVKETFQDIKDEMSDFVDIVNERDIICPNCKERNDPTSTFCKKCGSKIGNIKCPYCNQLIDNDSMFCPKCGNRL